MSRPARIATAILAGVLVLLLAGWFDGQAMTAIQRDANANFDPRSLGVAWSIGTIAVAAASLGLAVLAWRTASAIVGLAYAVVGAFFAFQFAITWSFATRYNGAPPILPAPLGNALVSIYVWSQGPLNATGMIGAAMLISGILVIGRAFFGRSATSATSASTVPDAIEPRPAQP